MKKTTESKYRKPKTLGKGHKFEDIDKVLLCARECFVRYGVEKTRLEDVAIAAGISRPLLYKLFGGRQGLTDAVINAELKLLVEKQSVRMQQHTAFRKIMVEGIIAGIELARKDTLLMDLLLHSSLQHLPALLLDTQQPAHMITLGLWKPYFDKAREAGELPVNIDDNDMMEWLMSIQYLFLMREEVNPERIIQLLNIFLVPVFIQS